MYQLHFDEVHGVLESRLWGFWSLDDVKAFERDMNALKRKYEDRFPGFAVLTDARELEIMSPEVGEAFGIACTSGAHRDGGRVATIVNSSLKKLQARRVVSGWEMGFFTDVQEARNWLLSRDRA